MNSLGLIWIFIVSRHLGNIFPFRKLYFLSFPGGLNLNHQNFSFLILKLGKNSNVMSGTSCICTISKHFLTFENFIYIEIISDCLDEIFQDNDFRSAFFFKRYTFNSSIKSSTTIDAISTESAMSKILISYILPCEGADCIKVVLMIIISACVILAWVDSSWIGPTEKKIGYNVNRLFILIHPTV